MYIYFFFQIPGQEIAMYGYITKIIIIFNFLLMSLICITVKLNANRQVAGVLRGFDPFMNLVLDETVEKIKDGVVNSIGMVVCCHNSN